MYPESSLQPFRAFIAFLLLLRNKRVRNIISASHRLDLMALSWVKRACIQCGHSSRKQRQMVNSEHCDEMKQNCERLCQQGRNEMVGQRHIVNLHAP